jgi:hypothetical protein
MNDVNECLELVSRVLLRCTIFGFVLFLVWFAAFLLAGDLIFRQAQIFGLTQHELNLLHYGGMGLMKLIVILFFLFPYVAIRLVLKKKRSHA